MVESDFASYYSDIVNACIELEEKFKALNDKEKLNALIEYNDTIWNDVNEHNLKELWNTDFFKVFDEFNNHFKGNITKIHEFDNETIIETLNIKKQDVTFYVINKENKYSWLESHCFDSLTKAFIYAKNTRHFNSIMLLLNDK
jgi:hypothetical protein